MKDLSTLKEPIAEGLMEFLPSSPQSLMGQIDSDDPTGYKWAKAIATEQSQSALDIIQPHWEKQQAKIDELQAKNEKLTEILVWGTYNTERAKIVKEQQAKIENASQLLAWHEGDPDFKGYKHPDQRKHSNEIHKAMCGGSDD